MLIGEGPGFHEDRQGRPFVGQAGQLLEGLLASIGLSRGEVFIANMVKCRPPDNRDPQPAEIAACAKYLDRQIELVNPKLIVTLGRFSLGRFFPGESVTRARGRLRRKDGRQIFPVLHPAAALRNDALRPTMAEDFRAVAAILAAPPAPDEGPDAAAPAGPEADPAAQIDLFGAFVPPAPPESSPEYNPEYSPDSSIEDEHPESNADQDEPEEESGPHQLSMF